MRRFVEIMKGLWRRSMLHRAMLVAPPVALMLWAGLVSVGTRSSAQFFTAKVEKGDISQVVQATGTINPVTTVQVGSVVSGNVVKIYADFNSKVKKDDIIAQIDPVPFQNTLSQVEADYQNAQANVKSLEAQIETARANVLAMKATIAKAQETQSEAQLKTTTAQRDQAKAQVLMKQAAVASARLQLNYCTIRAPIDGTVISRNVDVGQSVAASLQAPNLFSIGQDLTHMLVYTNTDEADVGRIQVGAQASFRVDTFPRETFYGRVSQVRMNAATIQNVVTYNTTIEFENPNVRLFPGMTAYVSIPVAWANNVVKVPNGALRFKPDLTDSERQALYAKYGIKENARATAAGRIGSATGAGGAGPNSGGVQAAPAPAQDGGQGPRNGQGGQGGGGSRRTQQGGGDAGGSGGQNGGHGGVANSLREDSGIVWKLNPDKTLEPIQVGLGVTDFTFTAMTGGKLNPGDELVIGQSTNKTTAQAQTRSPVGGQGGPVGGPRRF